jgi:hypothetical protein
MLVQSILIIILHEIGLKIFGLRKDMKFPRDGEFAEKICLQSMQFIILRKKEFSIWDERNVCLSWKETEEWADLLGLTLVPVFYKGIWDMNVIEDLNKRMEANPNTIEGYVVRLSREYHYSEFRNVCGKYVRKNHVNNNHGHWAQQKIIKNELK